MFASSQKGWIGVDLGTSAVKLAQVERAGRAGHHPEDGRAGWSGGGYETRLTSYSNLEPTAGRQIVEACLRLAGQMKPGAVPTPPKGPVAKTPWGYGNVPPELD